MKYIRTKYNTIADVSHLGIEGLLKDRLGEHEEFSAVIDYYGFSATFHADDIVGEADTIEELCDEFIWAWKKVELPHSTLRQYERYGVYDDLYRSMRFELHWGCNLGFDYEVYGAIWNDRGLAYVAKMNEREKFELL